MVQPGLAAPHAKLLTHVLGLLNHALGGHRPNRHSETPSSLLRAIKLWYIVPALLHSQDNRVKRRERFACVERGDITLTLTWLMEYTSRAATRGRGPTYEATDAAKYESIVSKSPLWRGVSGSTRSSRGTARARRRGDMGAGESQIPGRRTCLCFRVGRGSGGSKLQAPRNRRREFPQLASRGIL